MEVHMLSRAKVNLAAGARVRVKTPGRPPEWASWEPCQRTSNSVKKRLRELFFSGDRRVAGTVVYIAGEAMRDQLRAQGRVKVELRDAAGSTVVIVADAGNLIAA
jgi:hypothetical protein